MDTSLVASNITVPAGHVFVNKKWQGSELGSLLSRETNFIYSGGMGFIDFFVSETCPVIYITESDILLQKGYVKKIEQLAEVYRSRGMVIIKRTENFAEIQDLASIRLGMTTMPIVDQKELPRLLSQLAYAESRPNNPYRPSNPSTSASLACQVTLLSNIPGVGETGAKKLLSEFGHIQGVSSAAAASLKKVVGVAASREISKFFKEESSV